MTKINYDNLKINDDFNAHVIGLWKQYNEITDSIYKAMGGTANIVSEFAEKLVTKHYNGKQLQASHKSADVVYTDEKGNEKLIQVKSRRKKKVTSSALGIIRSWDFDYLVVVLFSTDGIVLKAIEVDVDIAKGKDIATPNKHQNGWVITTTEKFLEHPMARDITEDLNRIIFTMGENT